MIDSIICNSIALAVSLIAFFIGVLALFKKGNPLYFKLLVCAVGCISLEHLFSVVAIWCDFTSYNAMVGVVGIFGCNLFLLSANYGQLDSIVDGGSESNKSARKKALVAPILFAILALAVFIMWVPVDKLCAVSWVIILLPAMAASYYNLKHLLMPVDDFGFLTLTKPSNIAALLLYFFTAIYILLVALGLEIPAGIALVLMSGSTLNLVFAAVKGAEQWATLV